MTGVASCSHCATLRGSIHIGVAKLTVWTHAHDGCCCLRLLAVPRSTFHPTFLQGEMTWEHMTSTGQCYRLAPFPQIPLERARPRVPTCTQKLKAEAPTRIQAPSARSTPLAPPSPALPQVHLH